MSDVLNQASVLRLNGNYMRLGWSTPKEAFTMMMSEGRDGSPPALALDLSYEYDEFGKPIVEGSPTINIYDWENWIQLEPRKGDLDKMIHTSKRIIRIPTILVCPKFRQMPQKELKPTPGNIRRHHKNRCAYTDVELTNKTFSLDHVIPRSKGGKNTWLNLVPCHKDVNSKKGDKFNHEAGLKLLRKPTAPAKIAICALVTDNKHPDHHHFP